MTASSNRWVLLYHQVQDQPSKRGDHFDLMLSPKDSGPLWTWAIETNPLDQSLPHECSAERLPDHRRVYLDYEGPISDDRGCVNRVAQGSFEIIQWSAEKIELRTALSGPAIGQDEPFFVSLTKQPQGWKLRCAT